MIIRIRLYGNILQKCNNLENDKGNGCDAGLQLPTNTALATRLQIRGQKEETGQYVTLIHFLLHNDTV